MLQTYMAKLLKDRVQWQDDMPDVDEPTDVYITVLKPAGVPGPAAAGQQMVEALRRIADRGGPEEIADAAAWQRETRVDRPLSAREG